MPDQKVVKIIIATLLILSLASAFTQVVCDDHIKMYLKADDTTAFSLEDACLATGNNSAERGNATFGQPMGGTGSILYAAEEDSRVTNSSVLEGYSALTIDFALNITDNSSQQFVGSTGSNNFYIYWDGVGETFTAHLAIGGTDEAITINDHIPENIEAHYAIQYNYTHLSAWKDIGGTMVEIATPEPAIGVTNITTAHEVFCLGSYTTDFNVCNSRGLVGTLDEFIVSTVTRYGNNATAFTEVTPAVTSITVTSITPTDNEVNNTVPMYFNYSYTPSLIDNEYITNVTFHTNGTKELTNTSVIPDANISYFSKTFTASTEEVVTWLVSVETNVTNYNSSLRTFYWDDIAPIIAHGHPTNATAVIQEGNVTIKGTITDSNLHNVNITLYNSSGTAIWNFTTYAATSPYSYNQNIPLHLNNSGGTGTYDLVIEAADDHNKVSKRSKVQPKASTLTKDLANKEFTFKNNVWDVTYTLTSKHEIKSITTEFKDQKQSFKLETKETGNELKTYTIRVEGEGLVPINSKHAGHILKPNEYYLDFDGVEGTTKVKCYPTYCDVEIKTKQNTLDVKSIGGVNLVDEDVQFTVNNDPAHIETLTGSLSSLILETKTYNANITINTLKTGKVTNVTLWIDNTGYVTTLGTNTTSFHPYSVSAVTPNITDATDTLLFNFSFNLAYTNGSTETFTTTSSVLSISKIQLTQCSPTVSTPALEILLRDEITNAYVNGSLKATFTVFGTSDQNNETFSFEGTGLYNYTFCMFPSWSSLRVNSFEEYSNESYATRFYFLDYQLITNTTRVYNHYFVNNSNTDLIEIKVTDSDLQFIKDSLVYFYRYYPESNEYKNVAMVRTGEDGTGSTYLDTNVVYYRISVYKDRGLLETFPSRTISCTVGTVCGLTITLTPIGEGKLYENFGDHSTVCANTTTVLTCITTDSKTNLVSGNLQIWKNDIFGQTIVCNNNATVSGRQVQVDCPIPQDNGTYTYVMFATFGDYTIQTAAGYFNIGGVSPFFNIGLGIAVIMLMGMAALVSKNSGFLIILSLIAFTSFEMIGLTSFGFLAMGGAWVIGIGILMMVEWRRS